MHLVAERLIDRSHDLMALANDALVRKHHSVAARRWPPLNDDPRDHSDNPVQKHPPSAQRAYPAAVAGLSLKSYSSCRLSRSKNGVAPYASMFLVEKWMAGTSPAMTTEPWFVPSHSGAAPTGGPPGGRCRNVIVANAPSHEPTAAKATYTQFSV